MTSHPLHDRVLRSLGVILFGSIIACVAIWSLTLPAGSFDDSIQLTSALFTRLGLRAHDDFVIIYPPLNSYLISAAFGLLGESIASFRILQTTAYLVVVALLGLFATRVQRTRPAMLLAIAALTLELPTIQALTALMWSVLAVSLLGSNHDDARGPRSYTVALLAGMAFGATAMTRLNFALYVLAAYGVDRTWRIARHQTSLALVGRETAAALAGAVVVIASVLRMWGGDLSLMLHQVVVVPSTFLATHAISPVPDRLDISGVRQLITQGALFVMLPSAWLAAQAYTLNRILEAKRLALGALLIAVLVLVLGLYAPAALPALVLLNLGIVLFARWSLRGALERAWLPLLVLVFQFHYSLSRADKAHCAALVPAIAMLATCSASTAKLRARLVTWGIFVVLCGPAQAYQLREIVGRLAFAGSVRGIPALLETNDGAMGTTCTDKCAAYAPPVDLSEAVAFIKRHAQPNDSVFSGMTTTAVNDNLNDIRAYWLLRRRPATRHVMMMGKLTTTPQAEAEIISDLEQRDARWALTWTGEMPVAPGGFSSRVDQFLREKFVERASFGRYVVLERSSR